MAHLKGFEANFEVKGSPYYFGGVLEGLGGVLTFHAAEVDPRATKGRPSTSGGSLVRIEPYLFRVTWGCGKE